jgi:hypothetical protein
MPGGWNGRRRTYELNLGKVAAVIASNPDGPVLASGTDGEPERLANAIRTSADALEGACRNALGIENVVAAENAQISDFSTALDAVLEHHNAATADPLDALIVFYVGHATIHQNKLRLMHAGSNFERLENTTVPIDAVHGLIDDVEAKLKVLILDCCHGGRGLFGFDQNRRVETIQEDDDTEFVGAFGMAGASAKKLNWVPRDHDMTPFSKELCTVVTEGIDDTQPALTLHSIFREVRERMVTKGHTRPVRISTVDDERIIVAANPHYSDEAYPARQLKSIKGRLTRLDSETQSIHDAVKEIKRDAATLQDAINRIKKDEPTRERRSFLRSVLGGGVVAFFVAVAMSGLGLAQVLVDFLMSLVAAGESG